MVHAALRAKGIGPLDATIHKAGPGHYIAEALQLAPGGTWDLTVVDRVSDFDEYTKTLKVHVR
jgi:copper transport protein